jgi:hypothetical protein
MEYLRAIMKVEASPSLFFTAQSVSSLASFTKNFRNILTYFRFLFHQVYCIITMLNSVNYGTVNTEQLHQNKTGEGYDLLGTLTWRAAMRRSTNEMY